MGMVIGCKIPIAPGSRGVVSDHWGSKWGHQPIAEHIPLGRLLVENVADIVFRLSCHIFRDIEIYRGRPILYSAGDFVDDFAVDKIERNDESFILLVETSGDRMTGLRLSPSVISPHQAQRESPRDDAAIAERM